MKKTKNKTKAFGYLRVSGKAQITKTGFDRQEKTIRVFAQSNAYEIVEMYQEKGISGTKKGNERPAFQ